MHGLVFLSVWDVCFAYDTCIRAGTWRTMPIMQHSAKVIYPHMTTTTAAVVVLLASFLSENFFPFFPCLFRGIVRSCIFFLISFFQICSIFADLFFWLMENFTNIYWQNVSVSWYIHISNYFQTWENLKKKLFDKGEPEYKASWHQGIMMATSTLSSWRYSYSETSTQIFVCSYALVPRITQHTTRSAIDNYLSTVQKFLRYDKMCAIIAPQYTAAQCDMSRYCVMRKM